MKGGLIAEIRSFLREERLYSVLLIVILLTYAFIFAFIDRGTEHESEAVTKLKQVEKTLRKEQNQQEVMEAFLNEHPEKAMALFFLCLVVLLALLGGLAVDIAAVSAHLRNRSPIRRLQSAGVLWGGRDIVKMVILFFAMGLGGNFVLAFLKGCFFRNWPDNFLLLFHTTITDFFLLAMIIWFVLKKCGGKLRDLGLCFKAWGKDLLIGIAGYLGTLPLFVAVLLILLGVAALFSYEPPPHPLVEVFLEEDRKSPLLIGYSLVLACVLGPIIEEVFFRGFAYPALKKLWGRRWAMLGTSAAFALTHNSSFAFWPIFVLGLVLVYLYEERGSLIPSIVMHVTHNTLFIAIFFAMKRSLLDFYL